MMSMGELREGLATEYGKLERTARAGLIKALKLQGKSEIAKKVQEGESTMEDLCLLESYYATSLDYWILAKRFSIPLVLFSATALIETDGAVLVAHAADNSTYYYVKVPGMKKGQVSNFRLIARLKTDGGSRLPLEQLGELLQQQVQNNTAASSPAEYLESLDTGGRKSGVRRVGRLRLQS